MSIPSDIILYHYPFSPYARRITWYLALRRIPYAQCLQPPTLPRPDINALGISYRRIPVCSIGPDIYCDTRIILSALESHFPNSPLAASSPEHKAIEALLSRWAIDGGVFARAAQLIPPEMPLLKDSKFTKDREQYTGRSWSADNVKKMRPEALAHIRLEFDFLEKGLLADGREWILGTENPMLADVEAIWPFHWLTTLPSALPPSLISPTTHPHVFAWITRFSACIKSASSTLSKPTSLTGSAAAQHILSLPPSAFDTSVDANDPLQLTQGQDVEIWPIDSGFSHKDRGKLVGLSLRECVISVKSQDSGKEVLVHFPRTNFRIRALVAAGSSLESLGVFFCFVMWENRMEHVSKTFCNLRSRSVTSPERMLPQNPPRRLHSPDELRSDEPKRRKIRRKALSCYDCRRRKLRCDRELPACGRCKKAGHPDTCTYDPSNLGARHEDESSDSTELESFQRRGANSSKIDVSNEPTSAATEKITDEALLKLIGQGKRIKQLEARLARLESMASRPVHGHQSLAQAVVAIKPKNRPSASTVDQAEVEYGEQVETERMVFRGKGFKTQFYGATSAFALIAHFPEVESFMRDAIRQDSLLKCTQRDLATIENERKRLRKRVAPRDGSNLCELLPDKATLDHLVKLYFDTMEISYRTLHAPTFWEEYRRFSEDMQNAKPGFVAILLLMMAAVKCISSGISSTHNGRNSTTGRDTAISWIEACSSWVDGQSKKHLTIESFQVRFLLLLAKKTTAMKVKQDWTSAGELLRFAAAAGLHREPSFLGEKISLFDQEMRRRLWATMVEWELQSSVDRGMPPSSPLFLYDCVSPLNLDDEDLEESPGHIPKPRQFHEYTATSFLHVSQRTLLLRTSLTTLLNDPNTRLEYDEVLRYEEQILRELDLIPQWANGSSPQLEVPSYVAVVRTLLDIQLRQFLILLHSPFALRANSNCRYRYSTIVCFNSANTILNQHAQLMSSGNYALCVLRDDIYRAALCICHTTFVTSSLQNDLYLQAFHTTASELVEKALAMCEDIVMRLGRGQHYFRFIAAAYGLMRSRLIPQSTENEKRQATDRVANLFFKILYSQEDSLRGTSIGDGAGKPMGNGTPSSIGETSEPGISSPFAKDLEHNVPQLEAFDYSGLSLASLWAFDLADLE